MDITFKAARRCDCARILEFINALAEYEEMTDDVCATVGLLENWLFDKRAAEVIFAVADGREVAFALFVQNFSTFLGRAGIHLEDLFVLPDYRGRGIGAAMMRELGRLSVERGYGRIDWSCLKVNVSGIEFYKSLGAEPMNDWLVYRIDGVALQNLS